MDLTRIFLWTFLSSTTVFWSIVISTAKIDNRFTRLFSSRGLVLGLIAMMYLSLAATIFCLIFKFFGS